MHCTISFGTVSRVVVITNIILFVGNLWLPNTVFLGSRLINLLYCL